VTSILYLAASFFFLEWVIGPAWAVPMDIGGKFSGTVTGVMNMVGAIGGSLAAIVYGTLFDRGLWVTPFFVSAGVMALGALIWIFLIDPDNSIVEANA
jgi:sugar phosphate permease